MHEGGQSAGWRDRRSGPLHHFRRERKEYFRRRGAPGIKFQVHAARQFLLWPAAEHFLDNFLTSPLLFLRRHSIFGRWDCFAFAFVSSATASTRSTSSALVVLGWRIADWQHGCAGDNWRAWGAWYSSWADIDGWAEWWCSFRQWLRQWFGRGSIDIWRQQFDWRLRRYRQSLSSDAWQQSAISIRWRTEVGIGATRVFVVDGKFSGDVGIGPLEYACGAE